MAGELPGKAHDHSVELARHGGEARGTVRLQQPEPADLHAIDRTQRRGDRVTLVSDLPDFRSLEVEPVTLQGLGTGVSSAAASCEDEEREQAQWFARPGPG